MTENQIIYDIMELLRGNQVSDDTELDGRHIMFHVNNQRALWLRNEYNKPGRQIDHNVEQDLGCIDLVAVDAAECCAPVSIGCTVLRTEQKIPNTIELHQGTGITRVGPIRKLDVPFSFIPYSRTQTEENKYGVRSVKAYLLNNYIYLITPTVESKMLDKINVRGVFEDPAAAAAFTNCDGTSCYDKATSKYPVNSWMYAYFKEQVLREFGIAIQSPKDSAGDSQEILNKQ